MTQPGHHLSKDAANRPAWVREVELATHAHPQILLTGNVHDSYRIPDPELDGKIRFMGLNEALWTVVGPQGYGALLSYTSGAGVDLVGPRGPAWPPIATQVLQQADVGQGKHLPLSRLLDLLAAVVDVTRRRPNGPPVGLVLADAPRLFSRDWDGPDERMFLAAADRSA
jgi:ATP-dependent Clp protease ATP-binding subunit ClpB